MEEEKRKVEEEEGEVGRKAAVGKALAPLTLSNCSFSLFSKKHWSATEFGDCS